MKGEINERVTKIAATYNEGKMKKCVNRGTETCCAPLLRLLRHLQERQADA